MSCYLSHPLLVLIPELLLDILHSFRTVVSDTHAAFLSRKSNIFVYIDSCQPSLTITFFPTWHPTPPRDTLFPRHPSFLAHLALLSSYGILIMASPQPPHLSLVSGPTPPSHLHSFPLPASPGPSSPLPPASELLSRPWLSLSLPLLQPAFPSTLPPSAPAFCSVFKGRAS